jgi:hypothetical protein
MKRTVLFLAFVLILSSTIYFVIPSDTHFSFSEPKFIDIFNKVYKEHSLERYPIIYVSNTEVAKAKLHQNVKFINSSEKEYPYIAIDIQLKRDSSSYIFMLESGKAPLAPYPLDWI